MLTYTELDASKKAFVFELDNVLYPEQDYLLQVYYLFANFLEYTEANPPAADLITFLRKSYTHHGSSGIFERAAAVFGIDPSYNENFKRLHVHAKLPLPLLLYRETEELLQEITHRQKKIFILTRGNPLMQLNKVKQIQWGKLGKIIKVYFYDELVIQGYTQPLHHLSEENNLEMPDILTIGATAQSPYETSESAPEHRYIGMDRSPGA